MLSFSGATLEEAAAQFARYSALRIIIDDTLVAQQRVVGLYSATDPEGFAHAGARRLGLRAERAPGGLPLPRAPPHSNMTPAPTKGIHPGPAPGRQRPADKR